MDNSNDKLSATATGRTSSHSSARRARADENNDGSIEPVEPIQLSDLKSNPTGTEITATKTNCIVVGVGASAGGLEALEAFFVNMPEDSGLCFVVVQHLSPDFKSLMKELLSRRTTISVQVAEDCIEISPNTILLIPPRSEPTVENGRLMLHKRDAGLPSPHLPIDSFFTSMAAELGRRAVGVVLSGTGSDGSRGLAAIADAGGAALCQDPESAAFDGMPKSALATGSVHAQLEPGQMAHWLTNYAHSRARGTPIADLASESYPVNYAAQMLAPIFQLLSDAFQVNFNLYKSATIARRIDRRIRLKPDRNLESYVDDLRDNRKELRALYEDLLIGVTQFVRDPDAWDNLAVTVIPRVFESVGEKEEIRCWVAGTATGEEAYTLAILLTEYAQANDKSNPIRIFATDLHADSIEFGSQGVYPPDALDQMDADLVAKYFHLRPDGQYQVSADLRRVVVFAQHDLLRDPPFTKLALVTCRNVLIYFQQAAQKRAISLFHFGLETSGYLFLGASESVSELADEFETVDRRWKQYRKVRNVRLPITLHENRTRVGPVPGEAGLAEFRMSGSGLRNSHLMRAYDSLLEQYVPPSLLVTNNGQLLHTFGKGREFITLPSGPATVEISSLVRPELRLAVETGMRRIKGGEVAVILSGLELKNESAANQVVKMALRGVGHETPPEHVLISIEVQEAKPSDSVDALPLVENVSSYDLNEESQRIVKRLEDELRYSREQLQTTTEELETTNEELQATNEELMASNEELQSSNEELQSVNEELYSVNREYEEKIEELTQLNSDIDNLLVSTSIGTIFLDEKLQIRRFTPEAARHFDLLPNDIGRPLQHLNGRIDCPNLFEMLTSVATGGAYRQLEVQHTEGGWFLMRLHPYLNSRNEARGVVMTFVDITEQKLNERRVSRSSEDLQAFAYSVSHDLHAPLRGLLGFTGLLERRFGTKVEDDEVKEYFSLIKDSGNQLQGMLNGLLQFSRIITRGGEFRILPLCEAITQATESLASEITAAKAKISFGHLPDAWGDLNQISRVFTVLIKNALDYQHSGKPPVVRIRVKPESATYWRVEVRDNSTGIPDDSRESIFRLFNRGRISKNVKSDGDVEMDDKAQLGLGLAVARRIIDRHGGQIHCKGKPGGGSVFWFTVPKMPRFEQTEDAHPAAPPKSSIPRT
ncbi:MAG: chemotaxis protein CheB [Burkholderiaceae bacterium]